MKKTYENKVDVELIAKREAYINKALGEDTNNQNEIDYKKLSQLKRNAIRPYAKRSGVDVEELFKGTDYKLVNLDNAFQRFVINVLSEYANDKNEIDYKNLSKLKKNALRLYAKRSGVEVEELFEGTKYSLVNLGTAFQRFVTNVLSEYADDENKIDGLRLLSAEKLMLKLYVRRSKMDMDKLFKEQTEYTIYNIEAGAKLIQKQLDNFFQRKDHQDISLDYYKGFEIPEHIYQCIYYHTARLNDDSFKERQLSGAPAMTMSDYINTELKGYTSTKLKSEGPRVWPEQKIQANMAIKRFGIEMDSEMSKLPKEEQVAEYKPMGSISDSQWAETRKHANRFAVREGLAVKELDEKWGMPTKKAGTANVFKVVELDQEKEEAQEK